MKHNQQLHKGTEGGLIVRHVGEEISASIRTAR
jgi:hypothetical protein